MMSKVKKVRERCVDQEFSPKKLGYPVSRAKFLEKRIGVDGHVWVVKSIGGHDCWVRTDATVLKTLPKKVRRTKATNTINIIIGDPLSFYQTGKKSHSSKFIAVTDELLRTIKKNRYMGHQKSPIILGKKYPESSYTNFYGVHNGINMIGVIVADDIRTNLIGRKPKQISEFVIALEQKHNGFGKAFLQDFMKAFPSTISIAYVNGDDYGAEVFVHHTDKKTSAVDSIMIEFKG